MMTYIERKRYKVFISIAFLIGYLAISALGILGYFFLKNSQPDVPLYRDILVIIEVGFIGGFYLSSIATSIFWFIYFIKRKAEGFKIVGSILFLLSIKRFTWLSFILAGLLYLYNSMKLLKGQKDELY